MKQPEALRLADDLDQCHAGHVYEGPTIFSEAAAELRRLHEVNQELLEALKAIKDGTQFWESYPLEHCYGKARAAIAKATGEHA